jgi:hypothetical protein
MDRRHGREREEEGRGVEERMGLMNIMNKGEGGDS